MELVEGGLPRRVAHLQLALDPVTLVPLAEPAARTPSGEIVGHRNRTGASPKEGSAAGCTEPARSRVEARG